MTHNDSCEIRKDSFLVWTSRSLWLLKLSGFIGCCLFVCFRFDSVLKQFVFFFFFVVFVLVFKLGVYMYVGAPTQLPSEARRGNQTLQLGCESHQNWCCNQFQVLCKSSVCAWPWAFSPVSLYCFETEYSIVAKALFELRPPALASLVLR